MIRGPRCRGIAETAHHKLPSSTHPHLFSPSTTSRAPASRATTATAPTCAPSNRSARQMIAHLEAVVAEKQAQIEDLLAELARYQNGELEPQPRTPRPQIL